METCLIIPAPIRSHIIPSFYLASFLSKKYKILYACYDGELNELIQTNGFLNKILISDRFAIGYDPVKSWHKYGQKISFRFLISAIKNSLSMTTYKKRKSDLRSIIIETKPTLILIDIFSSTDFLIIKPLFPDIKIAFINPMLSTNNHLGYANVKGELYAETKKKSSLINSIKKMTSPKRLLAKLTGYDPIWQLNYIYKKNPILRQYPIDKDNKVVRIFKNIPEIILAPKEFEFSENVCRNNQLYLGLCQIIQRKDTLIDENYYFKIMDILKLKHTNNNPLIYCSFGSYFSSLDEHKYLISFCLYLIKAFKDKPMLFVMSVNEEIIKAITKYTIIPINFYFFFRVPQLMILKKADLFITHGGLGSIKESIFMQVPMLVYPLDLSWDQKGNAQKIDFHKIGISGNFKDDGLQEIKEKTLKLLLEPSYKQNLIAFSDKCTSSEKKSNRTNALYNFINLQI